MAWVRVHETVWEYGRGLMHPTMQSITPIP